MRIAIAAALFGWSVTSALSYGAYSVGLVNNGSGPPTKTLIGLSVDQPTKELAIQEAKRRCAFDISPNESYTRQCWPVAVFRDQCLSISRVGNSSYLYRYQIAETEEEARDYSKIICEASMPGNTCSIVQTACDRTRIARLASVTNTYPITASIVSTAPTESLSDHIIRSFSQQLVSLASWWQQGGTAFGLAIVAMIFVLCLLLIYTFRKLYKLQRVLATNYQSREIRGNWCSDTETIGREQQRRESQLNIGAVKSTFNSNRQEFDL